MRVLWISECPWIASGFGKVTYYMVRGLKKHGIDVICSCFSTFAKIEFDGVPVYPYGNPLSEFVSRLESKYGEIDVILYHGAPWISPLNMILPQNRAIKKRTIGYFVHEFIEAPQSIKDMFKLVHLLAVPAEFIARVVGVDRYVKVVHGVNPSVFYPREKNTYESVTIGMVAKNHPRKLWDEYFKALAYLARKGYRVRGLPYVFDMGYWNIRAIIEGVQSYYGTKIEFDYLPPYDTFYGVPEEEEAQIMNRMNIHVLLTRGEGFSLPIAETLALGIPNLTLDYPVMREIYGDWIEYVPPSDIYVAPQEGTVHYTPSFHHAVTKLEEMILNYAGYREKALRASEWVIRNYSWDVAVRQMLRALDEVMKYDNLIIDETAKTPELRLDLLKPRVIE